MLSDLATAPSISVIICTYGRSEALGELLIALDAQVYERFEVLIIDGNEGVSPARSAVEEFLSGSKPGFPLKIIRSEKGLTRQRNVGLRAATGDLLCFLDDDVTFDAKFFSDAAQFFADPNAATVGGITPYDVLGYPLSVTLRWRFRAALGVMPGSNPGNIDHVGRAVPIAFLKPFTGCHQVGWLPGFCMIYRRAAVSGLEFDELLPTYAGEDRDFSMRVGQSWRLLICGDLKIQHHYTPQGRDSGLRRLRESSFGAGRRFAKYSSGAADCITMLKVLAGDFIVDVIAFLRRPGRESFLTIGVRIHAFFKGLRSGNDPAPPREGSPAVSAEREEILSR